MEPREVADRIFAGNISDHTQIYAAIVNTLKDQVKATYYIYIGLAFYWIFQGPPLENTSITFLLRVVYGGNNGREAR